MLSALLKTESILIPTSFTKADLDKKEARKYIEEQDGEMVLISDAHHSLDENHHFLAQVKYVSDDPECYFVRRVMHGSPNPLKKGFFQEEMRLHYHDLQGLMLKEGPYAFAKNFSERKD